jgi:hypothetical protein
MNIPDHIPETESLEQFFGLKILNFIYVDPDPGSGIFFTLDPGSGMENSDSGSGMENSDPGSGTENSDPGSGTENSDPGSGRGKFGSGILDKHVGSATLTTTQVPNSCSSRIFFFRRLFYVIGGGYLGNIGSRWVADNMLHPF